MNLTLFIVDEALCVSRPCSLVNFSIPVAHWRNEKRKIVVAMVVVFCGSMTLTRLGRLRRKMKRQGRKIRKREKNVNEECKALRVKSTFAST